MFARKSSLEYLGKNNLIKLAAILAIIGGAITLVSIMWDAGMHVIREPETFWSIQHIAVYSGVSLIVSSAILGFAILIKYQCNRQVSIGIKFLIAGAATLIASGYADSISHEVFGNGELVSIPHIFLESSPALGVFGSFILLKEIPSRKLKRLLPISKIITFLAIMSIAFNLIIVFGGEILCIAVYDLLSGGCAIL